MLELLEERKNFCESRLDNFRSKVEKMPQLSNFPNLCIYATGSYGRLEASKHSDLDLFFIHFPVKLCK